MTDKIYFTEENFSRGRGDTDSGIPSLDTVLVGNKNLIKAKNNKFDAFQNSYALWLCPTESKY